METVLSGNINTDSVLIKCAVFTLEAFLSYVLYKVYRNEAECLESLKKVQCFELHDELKKQLENSNGEIKYAAVSGRVRALSSPLVSQHLPQLTGVIREKVTVERKVKWNTLLGIWFPAEHEILKVVNHVPFALCGKATNLFRKKVSVEVIEPLKAKELVVPIVYDEFHCRHDSIGDTVFGIIRGEKTLGIKEIERLLCENETLTAVGKLIIENNKLKIKPPGDGLRYILTPLSLESLIDETDESTKFFKVCSVIMGTLTLFCFAYLSRLAFLEIKKRINRRRDRKRLEEERRSRRMADRLNRDDSNLPKCIVCSENPVEVIILECGHICLCYNCVEHIRNNCPVCRNPISRLVSAFFP